MSGRELVECRRVNARILQVYGAAFGQDSADGRVVQVGEPFQQCRVGCRICRHCGAQLWIGGDDFAEVFWGGRTGRQCDTGFAFVVERHRLVSSLSDSALLNQSAVTRGTGETHPVRSPTGCPRMGAAGPYRAIHPARPGWGDDACKCSRN